MFESEQDEIALHFLNVIFSPHLHNKEENLQVLPLRRFRLCSVTWQLNTLGGKRYLDILHKRCPLTDAHN